MSNIERKLDIIHIMSNDNALHFYHVGRLAYLQGMSRNVVVGLRSNAADAWRDGWDYEFETERRDRGLKYFQAVLQQWRQLSRAKTTK